MKIGAAFPGQYIKASDLDGRRVQVVIDRVEVEDIGGETKPILHFKGKTRGLVLNKTNAFSIAGIVGTDETDEWAGHSVVLYPSKTDFQGKRVDCIRIDPPDRAQAKPTPEPKFDSEDDSVPF